MNGNGQQFYRPPVGSRLGAHVRPGPADSQTLARPLTQERRLATAAIRLDEALQLLRDAYRHEADREGPWKEAILEMQQPTREALCGVQAMVIELGRARRGN